MRDGVWIVDVETVIAQGRVEDGVSGAGRLFVLSLLSTAAEREVAVMWTPGAGREKIEHWLTLNFSPDVERISDAPTVDAVVEWARLRTYKIKGFVTGSTERASEAFRLGVPTALFMSPSYMRPEHRPDFTAEPAPWGSLVDEVTFQRQAHAADKRLDLDPDMGKFTD